jgi:hypothetical protein
MKGAFSFCLNELLDAPGALIDAGQSLGTVGRECLDADDPVILPLILFLNIQDLFRQYPPAIK